MYLFKIHCVICSFSFSLPPTLPFFLRLQGLGNLAQITIHARIWILCILFVKESSKCIFYVTAIKTSQEKHGLRSGMWCGCLKSRTNENPFEDGGGRCLKCSGNWASQQSNQKVVTFLPSSMVSGQKKVLHEMPLRQTRGCSYQIVQFSNFLAFPLWQCGSDGGSELILDPSILPTPRLAQGTGITTDCQCFLFKT